MKGNDLVCATLENGTTSCSRFQRHVKNRNEVIITNLKDLNIIVEEGVPKF